MRIGLGVSWAVPNILGRICRGQCLVASDDQRLNADLWIGMRIDVALLSSVNNVIVSLLHGIDLLGFTHWRHWVCYSNLNQIQDLLICIDVEPECRKPVIQSSSDMIIGDAMGPFVCLYHLLHNMFTSPCLYRYPREDEGLSAGWAKLAYTTLWEWYQWNSCWWNGRRSIVAVLMSLSLSLFLGYPPLPRVSDFVLGMIMANGTEYDIFSSFGWFRVLVKLCKRSHCWAIFMSSEELLGLTWLLLQNQPLAIGWMK